MNMTMIMTGITWEGGLGLANISQEGSQRRELSPRCFVLIIIIIIIIIIKMARMNNVAMMMMMMNIVAMTMMMMMMNIHTDATRVDLQSVEGLPHPEWQF